MTWLWVTVSQEEEKVKNGWRLDNFPKEIVFVKDAETAQIQSFIFFFKESYESTMSYTDGYGHTSGQSV